MHDDTDETIRQLVHTVQRYGLVVPTMLLVDIATPLDFAGTQLLLAVGPLLPLAGWRKAAADLAHVLGNAERRGFFRQLLEGSDPESH
jgi:hypothetical protein